AGFENQKELTKMQLDNQKEIAEMQNETQKEIAGIQSATSRQNTKDQATSYMAVGFYVAKYVNKKSDMDLAAKGLGAKEWNNSLKTKLSLLPKKLFRIRMSRNFGMKMLTMT